MRASSTASARPKKSAVTIPKPSRKKVISREKKPATVRKSSSNDDLLAKINKVGKDRRDKQLSEDEMKQKAFRQNLAAIKKMIPELKQTYGVVKALEENNLLPHKPGPNDYEVFKFRCSSWFHNTGFLTTSGDIVPAFGISGGGYSGRSFYIELDDGTFTADNYEDELYDLDDFVKKFWDDYHVTEKAERIVNETGEYIANVKAYVEGL